MTAPDPQPADETPATAPAPAAAPAVVSVIQLIHRAISAAEERSDAALAEATATLERETAGFAELAAPAQQALTAATAQCLRVLLQHWLDTEPLPSAEQTALTALGRQAAEQRLSLDQLLTAIRAARTAAWTATACAARSLDATALAVDALSELALGLDTVLESVRSALTSGHSGTEHQGAPLRPKTRTAVFEDLLAGHFTDEDEILQRARIFRFDLRRPHGLALLTPLRPDQGQHVLREAAAELRGRLSDAADVTRPLDSTPHLAMIVPCPAEEWDDVIPPLRRAARTHRLTGVLVQPLAGPAAILEAYRRARDLLPVTVLVVRRPELIDTENLLVYRLLRGSNAADRSHFLERTVGPLLHLPPQQRQVMLEVLDTLLDADGHNETAASLLGVHTNTVRYRLGRIRDLTGLRYDHPPDRFKLEMATLLLRMQGGAATTGPG